MSALSPNLREARDEDLPAIFEVNRLAFDRADEGRLVLALGTGGFVRTSLVAEVDGVVAGHILFSALPILTSSGVVDALALAPLAVRPAYQRMGLGSSLVREGLRRCQERGHRIVVVLGHPAFYERFGFSPDLARRLRSLFSGPAFMALELVPGALGEVDGAVQYPPPFGVLD